MKATDCYKLIDITSSALYQENQTTMGKPHVMMVPYPMQGHVIPLLELGQCLAKHGIRITFVNTEDIHQSIINSFSNGDISALEEGINLVSIHDGLDSNDRSAPEKLVQTLYQKLPEKLEELILEINGSEEDKITCMIYDHMLGRIGKMAKSIGIGSAGFWSSPASLFVLALNIPMLIEDGILDTEGSVMKNQTVQFGPTFPIISTPDIHWTTVRSLPLQKVLFNSLIENMNLSKSVDWLVCNSINDLEPGVFASFPQLVPIGPLLASTRLGVSAGHLWEQDYTCLEWLDQKEVNSVIYIAFGSSTMFKSAQLLELALGLENTSRPFLWVIRPEMTTGTEVNEAFPKGFFSRISSQGLIISWAPQQKVLSHRSVACFISHCGWNSTIESLSNGVPILCWPYFADQFMNRSYICDIWKVGLGLDKNDCGIIASEEIKNRVDQLLDDDGFKERALRLKETILSSAREGGNSYRNLAKFVDWIKS